MSVEPEAMGDMPAEVQGFDAVLAKTKWWLENHEIHSSLAIGPFVARDKFVVRFDIDVTQKQSGKRMQASEVGIYTVAKGKVVREEFLPLVKIIRAARMSHLSVAFVFLAAAISAAPLRAAEERVDSQYTSTARAKCSSFLNQPGRSDGVRSGLPRPGRLSTAASRRR